MIKLFQDWNIYQTKVSYIGTSFQGWQSQLNKNTIQDTIEQALFKIFKKKQKIIGASRTDAGVHANGQVFIFQAPLIEINKLTKLINETLPDTIYIFDTTLSENNFHPRFDAKKKIYEYKFAYQKQPPYQAMFIHQEKKYQIQPDTFLEYTEIFIGTHDFRSFCSESIEKNSIRTIFDISLNIQNNIYTVTFIGNGFLRYMIRRLLGAIIECNSKNNKKILKKIFLEKNKRNHFYSMPAKGLSLQKIIYNN